MAIYPVSSLHLGIEERLKTYSVVYIQMKSNSVLLRICFSTFEENKLIIKTHATP
jgi:hypothetical protein